VNGYVGTPYSNSLTASGGIPPYTFSTSTLPAGLNLNASTGAIGGTPTAAANNLSVTATVTDSTGTSATATAKINISVPATLKLSFPAVNGYAGTPYTNSLSATGGVVPYTYSISTVPPGLTLDASTGMISGVPTSDSSYQLTATVVDSTGTSATATATMNIAAAAKLSLQFGSGLNGQVGQSYSNSLIATGGFAPYTFSAGSLPAGLTLNNATGVISGTPTTAVSNFSVTATVVDSVGTTATATGGITINP
jgi:hypothetical protein